MVHKRIELLGQVILDLKDIELAIHSALDPSLIFEYESERDILMKELNEVSDNCICILEAYFSDCHEHNIPIYLNYHRVYKELKKSRTILC